MLGRVGKVPDVAIAFEDQVRTRRQVSKFLPGCIISVSRIPNRPQRRVGRTEPPKRCALHAQSLAGSKLVVRGNGVQHPHLVQVIVLVVVRVMRIHRVAVEFDVSVRFLDVQQCFLDAELRRGFLLILGI